MLCMYIDFDVSNFMDLICIHDLLFIQNKDVVSKIGLSSI